MAEVWYYKANFALLGYSGEEPDINNLSKTHILIATTEIEDLEEVFFKFNHWAGNKYSMRAGHTSMSVGDVVVKEDGIFLCEPTGWKNLKEKYV